MALEVRVQRARCVATKSCINAAPRTFALDPTMVAVVVDADADSEEDVLRAADACPTGAISVFRDGVPLA